MVTNMTNLEICFFQIEKERRATKTDRESIISLPFITFSITTLRKKNPSS